MKKTITVIFTLLLSCHSFFSQPGQATIIYFDYDQANLKPEYRVKLNKLISGLKGRVSYQVSVTGYTDADGGNGYNKVLSKQRTAAVADFFIKNGIDESRLQTRFRGENNPVADNTSDTGKQLNRRVEIRIEDQELAVPKSFKVAYTSFQVKPHRDTSLVLNKKGTVLHIPKNSFTDEKGNPLKAPVTLQYREYTNSAEIAFSGIPMTYKTAQGPYRFNSAGMFEINATCKKEPVQIAKDKKLTVDYAVVKKPSEMDFFKLKKDQNNWEKVQDIKPAKTKTQIKSQEFDFVARDIVIADGHHLEKPIRVDIERNNRNKQEIVLVETVAEAPNMNNRKLTLLGDGCSQDPGHTYPDIVKGLNVESFGVYNCDQIYQLANRVNIKATYETEDGKKIQDPYVLSLIDLQYNGAFSFDPVSFTCDSKAENVLALFTKSGKLFLLDKTAFSEMKIEAGGTYVFKMKDMSQEIKSSEDLAKYLGLKT